MNSIPTNNNYFKFNFKFHSGSSTIRIPQITRFVTEFQTNRSNLASCWVEVKILSIFIIVYILNHDEKSFYFSFWLLANYSALPLLFPSLSSHLKRIVRVCLRSLTTHWLNAAIEWMFYYGKSNFSNSFYNNNSSYEKSSHFLFVPYFFTDKMCRSVEQNQVDFSQQISS